MTFYGASHGIRREGVTTVQFNLEYQETRTNIMKFLIDTLYFEDVPLAGLFNMIGTGMFLSIKEAPVWATTGTFYIPPFGVYGKWCRVFYQPKPAMVPAYVSKGAGQWEEIVQGSRWALIDDQHMRRAGWSRHLGMILSKRSGGSSQV
jgi:hypothetical protein